MSLKIKRNYRGGNSCAYPAGFCGTVTARELMEILAECNPDDEIIIGRGLDDCEDSLQRIIYEPHSMKPGRVLFATEPTELGEGWKWRE